MRRFVSLMLVAVVTLTGGLAASGCSNDAPEPSPFNPTAEKLVDDLAAFKYAEVRQHFDADVAANLGNTELGDNWRLFEEELGNYLGRGAAKTTAVDKKLGITFITVPTTMENGRGEVRVAYRTNATIAGLYYTKKGAKTA